jgi:hypothetical protein
MALLVPAALALGACGDSGSKRLSAGAYRGHLAAFEREDNAVHAPMDKLPRARSVAEIRAGLGAFAAGEQKIGDQVAALRPPADAARANAQLAKGFHDTATELKALLPRLAAAKTPKDAFKVMAALGPSTRGGRELDTALGRLKKLGYAHGD